MRLMSAPVSRGASETGASASRPVRGWPLRAVVLGIAFLLALTTARNADLWSHLASGRAVATGSGAAHAGPHTLSWLADLGMYLSYSVFGGAGLIVGKSLIIATLALVMMGTRPTGPAVAGTLLSAIALGGWIPLNPICVSYLFLALTVATIQSSDEPQTPSTWRQSLRSHWPLLIGYVIWANMSIWCLLGVAIVAIHAVGRGLALATRKAADGGPWRFLALVLVASMLSPLPWSLTHIVREFTSELTNTDAAASPFRLGLLTTLVHRQLEGTIPIVAFWGLLVVSLVSFAWEARGRRAERFLPWVGLLAAAAADVRFAPFFVVVCGTTMARNARGPSATAVSQPPPVVGAGPHQSNRIPIVARWCLGVVSAVGLFAATWIGWLQPLPAERRNWTIEPDPSLVLAAETVGQWYTSGALKPDQRTVFFSPEAEDVFAWFAPQVVPEGNTGDRFARLRAEMFAPDAGTAARVVGDDIAEPEVGCIVLSAPTRGSFIFAFRALNGAPKMWTLAHLRGRVAVFVRVGTGPAASAVDLPLRAFGLTGADRIPDGLAPQLASQPHWYDPFLLPRPPRSTDRDEAVTYLLHEQATHPQRVVDGANHFLASLAVSIVAGPPSVPIAWGLDPRVKILAIAGVPLAEGQRPTQVPFGQFIGFLLLTDSSVDPYLAVRAGRRGVAASPREPAAYATLGEAYVRLLSSPLEASWGRAFPGLRRIRRVQAATAYREALVLDPSHAVAHLGLATIYLEDQALDLALAEFQAYERSAPGSRASATEELTEAVAAGRRTIDANSANMSVLDRARLAARNGLPGLALETLLASDVAAFGSAGMAMEFDLLLAVGRVSEAREWLVPEQRNELGAPTYTWLQAQIAAAIGDYADASLLLRAQPGRPTGGKISAQEAWATASIIGKGLLKQPTVVQMAGALASSLVGGVTGTGQQIAADFQAKTESHVLLAMIALEQGDMKAYAANLESIRKLWQDIDPDETRFPSPVRLIARQMRGLLRQ